MLNYKIEARSI